MCLTRSLAVGVGGSGGYLRNAIRVFLFLTDHGRQVLVFYQFACGPKLVNDLKIVAGPMRFMMW